MLYGWIVAGLLWLATAGLIYRSSGFQTPLLLPALGMAALMVWVQAVSWLPLPNSWLRDLMTIIILGAVAALPLWLTYSDWTSPALVAVLLVGLQRDRVSAGAHRRRDRSSGRSLAGLASDDLAATEARPRRRCPPRRRPFRSADEAQFWYEWKCHGLVLPGTVGLVLLMIMFMYHAYRFHGPPSL